MDSKEININLMFEMLKNQNEYADMYRQQQIQKRKENNLKQFNKKYYGNSKEYKKNWTKYGAMINK